MAKQPTNDELNLRRKARRRLIGAVALTLAVVVILPMVLDSEPKPTGQDIELRIPDPDKAGEFMPGAAASEVVEAAPLAVSAVEAAPVAASAVAASAVAQAKPVAASAEAANPKAEAQGKIQAAAKQPEAAESKGEAKTAGESFVAQVGAYASADTAKQELDRLKKLGFRKAYTERAGNKTRVRVGPYAEREKAEQVRQMLEKHGLKPVVMSAR